MPALNARRAGLTLNPFVFLLLLALVAVMVWRGWVMLDILNQAAPQLAVTAKKAGVVAGCVIGALLVCALAGGLGLALYFICGRSDGAANGGIGAVLLLAVGWFGYGTYVASTTPIPASATGGGGTGRTGVAGVKDQMDAMAERQRQSMERARQLADANRQASMNEMNRLRDGSRGTSPQGPSTTPPAPAAPTAPADPSPGTPTSPPPRRPASTDDPAVVQKAQTALQPLRDEIKSRTTAFLTAADPLVEAIAKPPRALRSELDKRAKDAATMAQQATELEAYFRSIDDKAERALKDAGLDLGEQIRQGSAFRQAVDGFAKANACGTYQRLFEDAATEAEELKAGAGRWSYDASGQVTSKDFSLQSRLRHLREGVVAGRRGITRARATLSAGTAK